ncbi:MAG: DUF1704 domain-containing protein [Gammaproteobacteria bacterium]|nr:MAG: DUF1704 domain-containing protein [Gammaproteobacteria bacterium]
MSPEILRPLDEGQSVDLPLEVGGRLHLDRPVPFLCVYRWRGKAPEADRRALVSSQAAWLVIPAEADVSGLLETLGEALQARFGGWLLLELWAEPIGAARVRRPAFEIHAPERQVPGAFLEAMEEALLKVRLRGREPEVRLCYGGSPAPPGLPPLLAPARVARHGGLYLGLAVDPVYRDPDSGEVHVFAHRTFRRRLDLALRRSFHAFAHACTTHRPAHYHELGPQRIPPVAFEIDQALSDLGAGFDLLLHVTPVNTEAAWEAFRASGFARMPELLYRPRTVDPDLLKRRLFALPLEQLEDPALYELFALRRDELDRQITLLSDRNTPRFLLGSRQLYGDVDADLLRLARSLLEQVPVEEPPEEHGHLLDARGLAARAEAEVARYRARDPDFTCRVQVREDVAGILVSHGDLLIGAGARVSRQRVEAALAHEIGTHALTWHNGARQPLRLMREGLAGYESLQEGLAVLAEYLTGQLDAGRLRQLAARVLAVHALCAGADFVELFRLLHREQGFGRHAAFMIALRVVRGGGYVKDAIYLRGLVGVLRHLAEGQALETLYVGKVAFRFLPLVEELRWRDQLHPPRLMPAFLEADEARARFARLRAGMGVLALAQEVAACASASS